MGRCKEGDGFPTAIYQIEAGMRRLLWVGPWRRASSLKAGLVALVPEVIAGLEFVSSDMWKPYLKVSRERISQVLHFLERLQMFFHFNSDVNELRRSEMARMRQRGDAKLTLLERLRWSLLKKLGRGPSHARRRLNALIASKHPLSEPPCSREPSTAFELVCSP